MQFAGTSLLGRLATRFASIFAPPYMARFRLAKLGPLGYVDVHASILHQNLSLSKGVFIADRVVIYQAKGGGSVQLGKHVHVLRDSVIETGGGGSVSIGEDTFLHPRAQIMAYKGSISIGPHATIAPNCALYAYNHGILPGELIKRQPIESKGGIKIGAGVWLGFGVIVLDGVTIGEGALVGAGAVVTKSIPSNAIAVGNPARVIGSRDDFESSPELSDLTTTLEKRVSDGQLDV